MIESPSADPVNPPVNSQPFRAFFSANDPDRPMNQPNIEFLRITYLRGPNIWTYRPAVEAWVDIGDLEDAPSNTIPGFYERLSSWLPGLVEHKCSIGERGGFLQRVREGTWPAHILEHVTLELQNLVGQRTGFGKARSTSQRGIYKIVVRSRQEEVTRACLLSARDLVLAAISDLPFNLDHHLDRLREIVDCCCLGPSTACIVDAATIRGIPSIRLNEGNLVQLGYGIRSRRIWTAETDHTSAIAEGVSRNKDLTKRLLQSCGIPVPEGYLVETADQAWQAAQDIGGPVVVKPLDGNHGRGVSTDLKNREEVVAAFELAAAEGSDVLVERFIPGHEHRLLVVGRRLIAAACGELAFVTGDGRSSVVELIDQQLNSDPRRGTTEEFPLNLILLEDDPAVRLELERQGLDGMSVPEAGRQVLIQRNGNVANDVTERVHPSIAAAATLAAKVVGLDIAGIDLVAEDISRPLDEQGGAIVEVNAGPGLLMHLKPARGNPQPVGEAIADHLFPPGPLAASGRIPIVAIGGSNGRTIIAMLVSRILQLHGRHVGLACGNGLFLDRRQVQTGDAANWHGGHCVLVNRAVDTAVIEIPNRAILAEGLAFDRCQIAVLADLAPGEDLTDFDIADMEQLIGVQRTLVDVVLSEGVAVLNAENTEILQLSPLCDGEVMLFATDPACPALSAHRATGQRAVFLRGGHVILATGAQETEIAGLNLPRQTDHDNDRIEQRYLLAAVAAAWALGITPDLIRAGIHTFIAAPQGSAVVQTSVRHKEKGASRHWRSISR